MSQETFYVLNELNTKEINVQLARQCAPVIAGIKISNLLIIPQKNEENLEEVLAGTGLMYYRMFRLNGNITYLIFRRRELENYVSKAEIQRFFKENGYPDLHLGKILLTVQKRYYSYMKERHAFPHELGLLLGYPIEDVHGFMQNKGKNYLYSGYWKVYQHMNQKRKVFEQYDKAMEEIVCLVSEGLQVREIEYLYRKAERAVS